MSKLPNQKLKLLYLLKILIEKTEKKSKHLIKKIGSLTSSHEAKQLTRQIYVADHRAY